jgi:hypothetical protein
MTVEVEAPKLFKLKRKYLRILLSTDTCNSNPCKSRDNCIAFRSGSTSMHRSPAVLVAFTWLVSTQ